MARSKIVEWIFLFISLFVYLRFGLFGFCFLSFSVLISYFASLWMNRKNKKWLFIGTIFLFVSSFLFLKISFSSVSSFFPSVVAPLGISYFTLQILSYLADVYSGKIKPEKNLIRYALYLFYFPCLFLGPIHRYSQFQKAFDERHFSWSSFLHGWMRILLGLFKKLIIAGRMSIWISAWTLHAEGGAYALFSMIGYSLLLYCDFSGGIDLVLGFSNMLGLTLQENFDRPFFQTSVSDFWNHWHISLSRWLRDYIYIPLGGNRVGKIRQKINVILTFLVSGIWHGTHYLLWGLFHGILVSFPSLSKTPWTWVNRLLTFLLVSISWAFFLYPDSLSALQMIGSLFTTFQYPSFFRQILTYGLDSIQIGICFVATVGLFWYESKRTWIHQKLKKSSLEFQIVVIGSLSLIVLLFGVYGIGFHVEEFIYSRF